MWTMPYLYTTYDPKPKQTAKEPRREWRKVEEHELIVSMNYVVFFQEKKRAKT